MANRSRATRAAAAGNVATAQRPQRQPNKNAAIQPQPDVVELDEVTVIGGVPDYVDPDEGGIRELPDDPDDTGGLRIDADDTSPIFSLDGEVVDLTPDGYVDTGPTTAEIDFVGSATDDDDDDDLDDIDHDDRDQLHSAEELAAARVMMAEAAAVREQARAQLAEAQALNERTARMQARSAAAPSNAPAVRDSTAVRESFEPVIVDAPPKMRIIRPNVDVGPVFYGNEEINLLKGRRYQVPEHIYIYLLERDLIWNMG